MKVIDLLNKIANGEEVPDIKWYARTLSWDNENKCFEDYDDDNYCKISFNIEDLNKEIKLIEEDKKEGFVTNGHRFVPNENGVSIFPIEEDKEIEEIRNDNFIITNEAHYPLNKVEIALKDKINELIKAVNELKKGK